MEKEKYSKNARKRPEKYVKVYIQLLDILVSVLCACITMPSSAWLSSTSSFEVLSKPYYGAVEGKVILQGREGVCPTRNAGALVELCSADERVTLTKLLPIRREV